jgi:hypothetical protein
VTGNVRQGPAPTCRTTAFRGYGTVQGRVRKPAHPDSNGSCGEEGAPVQVQLTCRRPRATVLETATPYRFQFQYSMALLLLHRGTTHVGYATRHLSSCLRACVRLRVSVRPASGGSSRLPSCRRPIRTCQCHRHVGDADGRSTASSRGRVTCGPTGTTSTMHGTQAGARDPNSDPTHSTSPSGRWPGRPSLSPPPRASGTRRGPIRTDVHPHLHVGPQVRLSRLSASAATTPRAVRGYIATPAEHTPPRPLLLRRCS